ncbi:hypothetical protein ACFVY4_27030 [Streptomyces sp. NPDC058299]|uniref:hypothetical protein n=1 Tax=Streptomyces sp. NPDC058299 TaxID=3346435 RepID=UPI0036EF1BCB
MTDSTEQQGPQAYEVAGAAVQLLGDQWSAEPGPDPFSAFLHAGGITFTVAPDRAAGALRIRNIDPDYTAADTRLLPIGSTAVVAQRIYEVIGEIF